MADIIADQIIKNIIDKFFQIGSQYLRDQVKWQGGMKEEVERLRDKLPEIQALVDYAYGLDQIKGEDKGLVKWLRRLTALADEANDLLNEIEQKEREKQRTRDRETPGGCNMNFINERFVKIFKRALFIDPTLRRLEKVLRKLDDKVSAHDSFTIFLQLVREAKQENQEDWEQELRLNRSRETGCFPKNAQIGRGGEKEFVFEWCRKTSNEDQTNTTLYRNISLLCVVGQRGMGKTTLLQHVFADELKKEEFDLKIWVSVSNNFDEKRVIADMLESVKNERPPLKALPKLQQILYTELKSKKFLLVLDDICEDDTNKWGAVLAPLANVTLASKILVTTRMESVASMLLKVIDKNNEMFVLKGLKDEECLEVLNKHAFANVNDPNLHQSLRPIAEKLVQKILGSPLAAMVIGNILNHDLNEGYWMKVLNYDIRDKNGIGIHNDTMKALIKGIGIYNDTIIV